MTPATGSTALQGELLAAAREGDEQAFGRLVEAHRRELHAHCYRMLGSVHDAEDAFQDAMLRSWRGLSRLEDGGSLRAWLYKIATNACLDAIARRPKRVIPVDYGPAADPHDGPAQQPVVESVWVEPYPDEQLGLEDGYAAPEARYEQREAVELAFVAALQHLPPNQRAALILREVLGYSASEAAEALDTTTASINSALQRARKLVDERLPEESQQATLRTLGDERLAEIVQSYMDAMDHDDVDGVVAMLAEDASWSMPPLASWFKGLDALSEFLVRGPLSRRFRWRRIATRANGQPAVAAYTWHESEQAYLPFALDVIAFEGAKIHDVVSFIARGTENLDVQKLERYPDEPPDSEMVDRIFVRFGLPTRLQDG
jgi:RNA polymerase sigma-70 factor (ECF subfamily)